METVRLKEVQKGELQSLEEEIARLWHSTYDTLLGKEQVAYMTKKFQSAEAIENQLAGGKYRYYHVVAGEENIGYCGVCLEETKLFLSKLYLKENCRGRGLGQKALECVAALAEAEGKRCVYLTVNKQNARAIRAYEKFGFQRTESLCSDIGQGYVMDDYVYEYRLKDSSPQKDN